MKAGLKTGLCLEAWRRHCLAGAKVRPASILNKALRLRGGLGIGEIDEDKTAVMIWKLVSSLQKQSYACA